MVHKSTISKPISDLPPPLPKCTYKIMYYIEEKSKNIGKKNY